MWTEKVAVEGPYDFSRAIRRQAFDPLITADLEEESICAALWIEGTPAVAKVKSEGTVQEPRFTVSSGYNDSAKVLGRLREIFKWDVPLANITAHFTSTDLRPLFEDFKGNPLVCDFNLYSCLMKSIIHQQLNLSFANTLTERFVHKYGFEQNGVWFYPEPEKVAGLEYEELQEMQFSRRKAEYVIDTSRLIVNGGLALEELQRKSDDEVVRELVKIRGVGPWTAESVLLFGMGRENLLPAADVGLQNAVKKLLGLEQKPSQAELREMGEEWAPYCSYASLYLWESLGNHSVSTSSK